MEELKGSGKSGLVILRQGLELARQHFLGSKPGSIQSGLTVSGHFKSDLAAILTARFAGYIALGNQTAHDPRGCRERCPKELSYRRERNGRTSSKLHEDPKLGN